MPGGHTAAVPRGGATKAELKAQREELRALRGERTQAVWAEILGVPTRTYIRYEMGQRAAPGAVLKLARLSAGHRLKRTK